MCGHVGAYGKINHKAKVMFQWLLHFDMVRGPHSTGIAVVREDNTTGVYKEVGSPTMTYLANPEVFDENGVIKGDGVKVLMGHNRFKTQGEINRDSAHPFEFEHVIGAHNGTIQFYLNDKLDYGPEKYEIDSQKVFAHLNKHEKPQTVWDIMPDESGAAMALVWWDKRNHSLNIARNTQRPMHFAKAKHEDIVFWASEEWMISLAAGVARMEIETISSLKANTHVKFTTGEKGTKVEVEALTPFTRPVVNYRGVNGYVSPKYAPKMINITLKEEVKGTPHYFVALRPIIKDVPPQEIIIQLHGSPENRRLDSEFIHNYIKEFGNTVEVDGGMTYRGDGCEKLAFFTLKKGIEAAQAERTKEQKEEDTDKNLPLADRPAMIGSDGDVLMGKALRKAMRAAGNACACCSEELFPSKGAKGAIFVSDSILLCEDCNTPEILDYLSGKEAKFH